MFLRLLQVPETATSKLFNISWLSCSINAMHHCLNTSRPHVLALTETWNKPTSKLYTYFRVKNRTCIYTENNKKSLKQKMIPIYCSIMLKSSEKLIFYVVCKHLQLIHYSMRCSTKPFWRTYLTSAWVEGHALLY